MPDSISAVSAWLWDYYLLASALLALVLLVTRLVAQPARRIAIHWATAIGLLLLAILSSIPGWSILHMTDPPPPEVVAWSQNLEPVTGLAIQVAELPQDSQPPLPAIEAPQDDTNSLVSTPAERVVVIDYGILVTYVICSGAFFALVWLTLGAWQVHRLRREAQSVPNDLQEMLCEVAGRRTSLPQLGLSQRVPVAVAIGIRHPMILLPSQFVENAGQHDQRGVLAHELAHIRNRDLWLLALVRGLLLLFWAHPLYWLWRRGLRLDQETLADAAASELTSQHDYADQLVTWARNAAGTQTPRFASSVGLWESPSQLKQRIVILLDEKLTVLRNCSRRWRVGSIATLLLLAGGLSLFTLQPEAATVADELDQFLEQADYKSLSDDQKRGAAEAIEALQAETMGSVEDWGKQIRTLVEIGKPIVPKLIAALDQEERDHPIRKLVFTLRAIDDPRAIPALIRVIPRTHLPAASDHGLQVRDEKLGEFLKQHDTENDGEYLTYGRALTETFRSLHKMSGGKSFGEMELIFVHKEGTPGQQELQRQLFQRVAENWAEWWETNWTDYVKDNRYAQVGLKANEVEPVVRSSEVRFPAGVGVYLGEGQSGVSITPNQLRQRDDLLDLDSSRQAMWPTQFEALGKGTPSTSEMSEWWQREGFDLLGYVAKDEEQKMQYGVRMLDLRAWKITEQQLADLPKSMTGEIPYPLDNEVKQLEPLHLKSNAYDDDKAEGTPYLFRTREGTYGLMKLHQPGGFPYPSVKGKIRYFVHGEADEAARFRQSMQAKSQPFTISINPIAAWKNTVEILAIGTHDEEPQQWWDRQGQLIEDFDMNWRIGTDGVSGPHKCWRRVVMLVPGLPTGARVSWHIEGASAAGGATVGNRTYGGDGYYSRYFNIAEQKTHFRVRVGVAAGDWKTAAQGSPGSATGTKTGLSVIFSTVESNGSGSRITYTHNVTDQDYRIVAIDKAGKRYPQSGYGGISAGSIVQSKTQIPSILPGQIDRFEFQVRDYEWVTFKDLPTQPGENDKKADQLKPSNNDASVLYEQAVPEQRSNSKLSETSSVLLFPRHMHEQRTSNTIRTKHLKNGLDSQHRYQSWMQPQRSRRQCVLKMMV